MTPAFSWDPLRAEPTPESLKDIDTVIHLAGEPVAQRWNAGVKQRIRDSRVLGTRHLMNALDRLPQKPKALICASAIGYYGDRGDEVLTESSGPGSGFLSDLCRDWEAEADRAMTLGIRAVKLRIGFVLGKDGGALAQLMPIFRGGAGGRLGSGKQWMPWVHLDDAAGLFLHAAENNIEGVWNASAPHPVVNADFTRQLAAVLHRPAILPVPAFALKLAFGEFGGHMLDSARVIPAAAAASRFTFRYPELPTALANLTKSA